jgi:integrase
MALIEKGARYRIMDLVTIPGVTPTKKPATLAELAAQVASWPDLPDNKRRDLLSAIQTASRIIGKPPAAIRADDLQGLSAGLYARHHAAHGMGRRRFGNVVAGLRAALRLVGLHAPLQNQRIETLPATWLALVNAVGEGGPQSCLAGFARWCDAKGRMPQDVLDATLAAYAAEMAASKISAAGGSLAGMVARAWNDAITAVSGPVEIPFRRLTAPVRRATYAASLEELSPSFREDLDRFSAELSGDVGSIFKRIRQGNAPRLGTHRRRAATINARVFAIRQSAGLLASNGIDLATLVSLRDLVQPLERVEIVLEALAQRRKISDGAEVELRGSHLAQVTATLVQVGKFVGLEDADLNKLRDFNSLVTSRDRGMSRKNYERMAELSQPRARALLLNLPKELMRRAKLEGTPTKEATRLALRAAAIEMLLVVPIRRQTLLSLELGKTIIRSGTRRCPAIELKIPGANTKNSEYIPRSLPEASARLLCEYIDVYRPLIAHAENCALFPGHNGRGTRSENAFTHAVTQEVEAVTGVKCSPHIFRHVAAERYLRKRPGAYEEFRHVLSNRSAEGTHRHYAVLEAQAAATRFDDFVHEDRRAARLIVRAGRKTTIREKVGGHE